MGTAVAQWLRRCATNRKVAGSVPAGVIGFFVDIKSFRSYYSFGVHSASNRNEYQVYLLGVKSDRSVRLITLLPSCAVVTKSGNLNFLEPSGHLGPVMGVIYLYLYMYISCPQFSKFLPISPSYDVLLFIRLSFTYAVDMTSINKRKIR